MSRPTDTLRVVIPLAIRRRNGRPRVLPPENADERQWRAQDPHILKALGRAWAWRRKLESGEVSTAGDLAKLEGVTERFVSRTMRVAYLSPEVIKSLIVSQLPLPISMKDLITISSTTWMDQERLLNTSEPRP
jgi:hypothetical protein